MPDETPAWGNLSAADLVRRIYRGLAIEGRSCRSIAAEFNALAIPTHAALPARGARRSATQRQWRPGRIRNMVVSPIYMGVLQFGRRTTEETKGREVITASIEPLVSAALWQGAQETLAANRLVAKNVKHDYLLRSVMRCGDCGLAYCGSQGRPGVGWYRCNGQLVERGPIAGRCRNPSVRTDTIEPVVWADVEAFLRDPGSVLAELQDERGGQAATHEAESLTLRRAVEKLEGRRLAAIDLGVDGLIPKDELRTRLERLAAERAELDRRLVALSPPDEDALPEGAADLLAEIRGRLDQGLTIEQRQEVVQLLVRIVVRADPAGGAKAHPKAVVEYRFPGVAATRTGRGSSRPRAGRAEAAHVAVGLRPCRRATPGVPPADRHGRSIRAAKIKIGATIGIASRRGDSTAAELLRDADATMYAAKADGKGGLRLFERQMHASVRRRLEWKGAQNAESTGRTRPRPPAQICRRDAV